MKREKDDDYGKIVSLIFNSVEQLNGVNADEQMVNDNPFIDPYTTKEQRQRDEKVTELLA